MGFRKRVTLRKLFKHLNVSLVVKLCIYTKKIIEIHHRFSCEMFNTYPANILIMAERKSLIVKTAVPVAILAMGIMFGVGLYFSWIDTSWETAQYSLLAVRVLTGAIGFCGLMLLIGAGAQNAGFKQEELDKWGDDAMSGKPPI